MLLVDTGDFFFRDQFLADFELAQLRRKANVLAQGAKVMGYELTCPGEADLAMGLGMYKDLLKAAGMQAICANLKIGNDLVLPATAIRVVDGIRIGFFGLLQVHRPLPAHEGKQLLVDSTEECAKKAVGELTGKVDLIVALTHQGFEQDRSLARKVSGIDVILGGHSRETLGTGSVEGKTAVYQAGYQGKYMGAVKLVAHPAKPPATTPSFERASAEAIPMDPVIKDEPQTAGWIKEYHAWVAERAKETAGPDRSPVPRREEQADVYWGQALCGQCHPKQDEFWQGTIHAVALETLKKKGKASDMECLPCHTTGFRETRSRPENRGMADVTGIENVQCEACHAPGSRHNTPEVRLRASRKATCVVCHDAKNSPKFDFEKWLPRMRCPPTSSPTGR